jgi:hypothetical protein
MIEIELRIQFALPKTTTKKKGRIPASKQL